MASIDKRPNGKYRARWREYAGGPQKTRSFDRKIDAQQFLVKQQHDLMSGVYVAPEAARTTVAAYSELWLERMLPTWRPSTGDLVLNSIRKHVVPSLGSKPLTALRRGDVEAWAAALELAPSTVRTVHQHLGQLLDGAVSDGLIMRNVASRARLPRATAAKPQPVDPETIEAVRLALPDWMRIVVPLGVGVGLRQSEVSGLQVDRLDMLRRNLRIDQQYVRRGGRPAALIQAKTDSSNRTIPLAGFVVAALASHLQTHPAVDGFVLSDDQGRPVDSNHFGHAWRRAVKAAGVPGLKYHALRHTFASTLLSRGVSVKAVADWLGHASPTITLSTYAHLMPADEEVARAVLDAALGSTERATAFVG